MTNLDSILKSRDTSLPTKVHPVKAMVFPVVMDECESWTIKKAEHQRSDAFELWCWRRLLRVPWTARRSNQSTLKEISPEYSLEGLILKLKLQSFGHLMWKTNSLEKTLMLGKIEGGRRGWQRMRWLDGITDSTDMSLSKLQELVMGREAWRATGQGSQRVEHDWVTLLNLNLYEQAPCEKAFSKPFSWVKDVKTPLKKKIWGSISIDSGGCLPPGLNCFTSPGLISAKLSTQRMKGIPELKRIQSPPEPGLSSALPAVCWLLTGLGKKLSSTYTLITATRGKGSFCFWKEIQTRGLWMAAKRQKRGGVSKMLSWLTWGEVGEALGS